MQKKYYALDAVISVGYRAKRHIPMTMEDWATRIDKFLDSDDRPILNDAGRVSTEEARLHAESEFEKYRIIQDRFFQSDFDKYNSAPELDFKELNDTQP